MNTTLFSRNTAVAAAVSLALFVGCASPKRPDGADTVRNKLTQLQSDPQLGTLAPLAIRDADKAVVAAEQPQKDTVLGAHLVLVADRKVGIAQAQAESSLAVSQRTGLAEQRAAMQLRARTQEADSANLRATDAQAAATQSKQEAQLARNEADLARDATAEAQRNEQEMQRQIAELQAKVTDRGLVVTLGDVLFASGTANLNAGSSGHLDKLAAFLNKYPDRSTVIEGHTDSVGTDEFNQGLSQRRADAVKSYLARQGITGARLTASGKGEGSPIGDNTSPTGRQQNRRVEVIIENQMVSAR